MEWIFYVVVAAIILSQLAYARYASKKLNTLNEYVQFLLFHRDVYDGRLVA